MRFTAHRVFFVWDFEEEEKWINEMAAKGMNCRASAFVSTFLKKEHRGTTGIISNG